MYLDDSSASIFIAGHRGLVGSAVVSVLRDNGFSNLILRTKAELDLTNQAAVLTFFEAHRPEFVVLAAAKVGGILANDTYPADFLYQNLAMELNVIQAAHQFGVKRLIFLGSSCIYPKFAAQPLEESALLTGALEPTNEWYAVAKIAGIKLCQALRKQFGADFVSLMPTNLYGIGDNFNLQNSHVLPALIRKFHEAKQHQTQVILWGTGTPLREFLNNWDLAEAVLFVLKHPENKLHEVAPDGILNVGFGEEVSIRDLAVLVQQVVGYHGKVVWDTAKPDGTPRKLLDSSRIQSLGWTPRIPLKEGIQQVYTWFLSQSVLREL